MQNIQNYQRPYIDIRDYFLLGSKYVLPVLMLYAIRVRNHIDASVDERGVGWSTKERASIRCCNRSEHIMLKEWQDNSPRDDIQQRHHAT